MLPIPLGKFSNGVSNILGENLYFINSDENQITSTQMQIPASLHPCMQPCQIS